MVDAHLCLQETFTAMGFTGGPVELKVCAKFKSCAWDFGQVSDVL